MAAARAPLIALAPDPVPEWASRAVVEGGGAIAALGEAEALVWNSLGQAGDITDALTRAPNARWVHLRWAGVEQFVNGGLFDDGRTWTCGKGVFSEPVAEHALALALAGLRDFPERMDATRWGRPSGVSLYDGNVTILGGGGIAEELVRLLAPMRTQVTVVRRRADIAFPGAVRTLGPDRVAEAVAGADAVVVALALTAETAGMVNAKVLDAMAPHGWLVNVGRGRHVVTDDLVDTLQRGSIGGAALDVTDPEPLPEGHPLWALPNVIITPHTANTFEMALPALAARLRENVARFAAGEPLVGVVDPRAGY